MWKQSRMALSQLKTYNDHKTRGVRKFLFRGYFVWQRSLGGLFFHIEALGVGVGEGDGEFFQIGVRCPKNEKETIFHLLIRLKMSLEL